MGGLFLFPGGEADFLLAAWWYKDAGCRMYRGAGCDAYRVAGWDAYRGAGSGEYIGL